MVAPSAPTSASSRSVLLVCDLGHMLSHAAAGVFQQHADQSGLPVKFTSTGLVPANEGRPPHRLALTAGFVKPSDSVMYVPMQDFVNFDLVVAFDHEMFHRVSLACRKQAIKARLCSVAKPQLSLPHWTDQPHRAYGDQTLPVFDLFRSTYLSNPGELVQSIHRWC